MPSDYRDYNAFGPHDLQLAQTVLDHVWASLPNDVRSGARGPELRDWLAKQVLASIKHQNDGPDRLETALLTQTNLAAWS